jgi:Zn-dependent protease
MIRPDDAQTRKTLENLHLVAAHLAQGPRPAAPEVSSSQTRTTNTNRWKRWGPLGGAGLFLAGKLKVLLPFLKFANLGTLLSMLVAVGAYTMIWGFPYALGFVVLIFVHESGHAVAMRQQGLRAGAPVFIPFVGAIIAMKDLPRNAHVEAVVGIGGPLLGTLGAMVCLLVGWLTGSLFWYALASTGFLINLFNLIPISPLDGGRIVGVISRWLWVAGYAIGIVVLIVTRSPLLFLILVIGLFSLGRLRRGMGPDYYTVPTALRVRMAAAYFGLLAVLATGMWVAQQPLAHLH